MPAISIKKFLGIAPKVSPELLPETVAQVANNVKLYSGDLIPISRPTKQLTLAKGVGVLAVYPMDDGAGGFKWLHWLTDVDVARVPLDNNTTQRIIYTGDSEPRATDYSMATTGAGTAYPYAYYTLGLPTPLVAPTVAAVSFSTLTTATRSRDSGNTATLTFAAAHGLSTGTSVTITLCGGTGYNLSNVQINVLSTTSFSYYSSGAAEISTADTAGRVDISGLTQTRTYVYTWYTAWGEESTPSPVSSTLYLKEGQVVNISELPAAWPGTYIGTYQTTGMKLRIYRTIPTSNGTYYFRVGEVSLGTTTFTDNIAVNTLSVTLPSTSYDSPSATMKGIKAIHNGMLVGFYGNTVCFSEPGQPHAWPTSYRINLDSPIVAIGNFGTSLIAATDKNPWLIQGSSPQTMAKVRMDYVLPCTSKRSMVNMGYGVAYASTIGLAVYSSQTGGAALTKYVHDWDTWNAAVNRDNLVAAYYNDKYFACDGTDTFMFLKDDQVGGYLTNETQTFSAAYYDSTHAKMYYVYSDGLYLWDDPANTFESMDWKSKVIKTKDYQNLGAARVIADYNASANDIAVAAYNAAVLDNNQTLISTKKARGAIGGGGVNLTAVAGSLIKDTSPETLSMQFQLYVDKILIFTATLTDSGVFRLPTGYRSDTFEVRVSGNRRVRAIHLAETPLGLKDV